MLDPLRRVVLAGLVIFGLSMPAFGATTVIPHPGAPCPKAQMIVVNKGLMYACLQSGKKLLWSPGKKSSSNSSQGQTPIPSGLKALVDAGRFGIVRNISSTGQMAQPMDCTKSDGNRGYRSDKTFVVDPSDPLHLMVGIELLGFFTSHDGGITWADSSSGLIGYPRIDDKSKPCHTEFADVAIDPRNSKHLILARAGEPGTIKDYFSENAGLYESHDSGSSWKQILIQENLGVYVHDGVGISHQDSNIIYAGTTTNPRMLNNANKIYPTVGIVYKTVNDGKSWVELPTGAPANIGTIGLFVDPSDDNIVTVATIGRVKSGTNATFSSGLGIIKTTDGGKTWKRIDSLTSAFMRVEFSENSPQHLVACCGDDGNMEYSKDGGSTWVSINGAFGPRAMRFDEFDKSGLSGLWADNSGAIFQFSEGGAASRAAGVLPALDGLATRVSQFDFGVDGSWYAAGHYTGQRGGVPYQEGFVFKSSNQGASWLRILDTTKLEH